MRECDEKIIYLGSTIHFLTTGKDPFLPNHSVSMEIYHQQGKRKTKALQNNYIYVVRRS